MKLFPLFIVFSFFYTIVFTSYKSENIKSSDQIKTRNALLIIDVQNCFLPGGAIPIKDGNSIIPIINSIRNEYYFETIVRNF